MTEGHSVRATGWARSIAVDTPVGEARAWTRRHLRDLGWTHSAPDTADAVVLAVSELVTNAHRHARGTAHLILAWDGTCLHVSVHDGSPDAPRLREPDDEASGGRGILLVDALASTWQVQPCPRGKIVTACFQPTPTPQAPPADG
ncbi:ATP-binding protein [Actinacidiphila rubida]|uniref:Anti-sigma regulatory factor (Ser/Thr protein kinase) n=1 Tax=Actinacidiphila rubida TaxID=310780 RepID=A0A1H8K9G9_9ACTN|nr:ATP-binding protein [Actinacidiphila rubida]SEN89662.1 Anti-sigma regulatory factor (Ser/Thr protein kinase) [Actinacidiphila rubida]